MAGNQQVRLGILGGGQLARMLALEMAPLGVEIHILCGNTEDPAGQVTGNHFKGSVNSESDLREFIKLVDAITFESEFIDLEALGQALESLPKKLCFPSLTAISRIQDRLNQKRLLDELSIPTSPWCEVSNEADLEQAWKKLSALVLKQRRFGYDGYGTFVFKRAYDKSVLTKSEHGFIAERFISFKRELACTYVRGKSGEFIAFPLVESVQRNSRCYSVQGPTSHPQESLMRRKFKTLMHELDYVGALAVEFFETASGLIVNELAPRVHNSAHYSLDALNHSQFEYHGRAGLGFDLPKIKLLSPAFAMINLLGEGNDNVLLSRSVQGHLHWYGKKENTVGRKLGHINTLAPKPSVALKKAEAWRKEFVL